MNRIALLSVVLVVVGSGLPIAVGEGSSDDAALRARAVFKQYCHRCHSGAGSEGGEFDVLDASTLTAARDGDKPLIVAGKPDASYLLERILKGTMPPKTIKERPTDADKEALKKWIAGGAPPFPSQTRKSVSARDTLNAMRGYLRAARVEDRPYLQFVTLAHLHNNLVIPDTDLRVTRAAFSKAINSMHWKPRIVLPKVVDESLGTLMVIDIRDLDWDKKRRWREVQVANPYAMRYDTVVDEQLRHADVEIAKLANLQDGDPFPLIRADWFVSSATRPLLYHILLDMPETAMELEKRLGVDAIDNFKRDRLVRAGFGASGVSRQNRLLERHEGAFGAYWKSFDFQPNNARSSLSQFPLGPNFASHPYSDQVFDHDGGEIIFSLPNRMQGYMLVNSKDRRIDVGPIAVVGDSLKTSGTAEIVNGLSCMACHKHGMIKFADTIRDGHSLFGNARQKVARLYPLRKEMDGLVKEDAEAFMHALGKTVSPFLKVDEAKDKSIDELTDDEPIAAVARLYKLADLDLATAAYELDVTSPAEFKGMISGNKRLQSLGLGVLTTPGGRLKREDWESAKARSLYQIVAAEIGKGTPLVLGR